MAFKTLTTNTSSEKKKRKQPQQPSLFHFWGSAASTNCEKNNPPPVKGGYGNRKGDPATNRNIANASDCDFLTWSRNSSEKSAPTREENCTRIVSPCTRGTANHNMPEKLETKPKRIQVHAESGSAPIDRKCATITGEKRNHEKSDSSKKLMDDSSDETQRNSDNEIEKGDSSFTSSGKNKTDNKSGLSEYELLRLRNIERNNARLRALGLLSPNCDTRLERKRPQSSKRKRQKLKGAAITRSMPTRKSLRNKSISNQMNKSDVFNLESVIDEVTITTAATVADEEEYEASPVFQYHMEKASNIEEDAETSSVKSKTNAIVKSKDVDFQHAFLEPTGKRLIPPKGLGAIYTMQFYSLTLDGGTDMQRKTRSWLIGAGKAGIVALWDCSKDKESTEATEIDPILSWRAHSGRWIADARFIPGEDSPKNPSKLVTAANDGAICLWDLTKVSVQSGAPKLLQKTGKELHSSGIFAMDVLTPSKDLSHDEDKDTVNADDKVFICTGSKDKTVALSSLSTIERNRAPLWRSDFHTGKVSAVRFRRSYSTHDVKTIASASDDGLIAIHDCRKDGRSDPAVVLENAHNKPHSVVWHPSEQDLLMTAGLDETIKVWDVRFLTKPMFSFYGHVPVGVSRLRKIHHPTFYIPNKIGGSFVLTGSENSYSLSMFKHSYEFSHRDEDTITSAVFSRGKLPEGCGDVGTIAINNEMVAASIDGGEVLLLACK
mmetsp:Transcript_9158/g.14081  ORF Transcript_9158/g.14081 Transcript_9158/m.14081 type:complete len:719 (+) Transcript_9158:65-2221(+)